MLELTYQIAPKEINFVDNAAAEFGLLRRDDRQPLLQLKRLPEWREYRLVKLAKTLREKKEQLWVELEMTIESVFDHVQRQAELGFDAEYPMQYRPDVPRATTPLNVQHDGHLTMPESNELLLEAQALLHDNKLLKRATATLREWLQTAQAQQNARERSMLEMPQLPQFSPFPHHHHHGGGFAMPPTFPPRHAYRHPYEPMMMPPMQHHHQSMYGDPYAQFGDPYAQFSGSMFGAASMPFDPYQPTMPLY